MKIQISKTTVIFSIIIFAISSFLRFWQLPERFSWTGVEGSFIWDIWYVALGHPTLIGFESAAIGGFNFPPFLLYFLVPFFWIFQGNPIYIGIILAILGSLTSVLFFLIGKTVFSTRVGLMASFIHIFSLHAATIDHKFIGGTFIVPASLLVVSLIWRIVQKEELKSTDLIILGSIIGLSFSLHYQAIFLLVGVIITLLIYKIKFFNLKKISILLISTIVWLSTLLLFDLRHDFYHIKGITVLLKSYTSSSITSGLLVSSQYLLQNFFGIFWQTSYFFKFGDLGILLPLGLIVLVSFFFYLLIWEEKSLNSKKSVLFYFACLFSVGFGILSFYRSGDYQFDYYYWYLVPSIIFLAAVSLELLFQKKMALISIILLVFFGVINLNDFVKFHSSEPYSIVEKTVKTVLIDAKKKNLSEVNVKFHGVEAGSYDYLFYWYAKKLRFQLDNITLISNREEFQERSILGSGKAPIKLLSKGASLDLVPNYVVTKNGVQII